MTDTAAKAASMAEEKLLKISYARLPMGMEFNDMLRLPSNVAVLDTRRRSDG